MEQYSDILVIVTTEKEASDKEKGFAVGADIYLVNLFKRTSGKIANAFKKLIMAKFRPLSDQELKDQFIKEVKEHLFEIESNLLLLEKG